jgi:histone H3/H4
LAILGSVKGVKSKAKGKRRSVRAVYSGTHSLLAKKGHYAERIDAGTSFFKTKRSFSGPYVFFAIKTIILGTMKRILQIRIGAGAPVYLAEILEYLTAEILELAVIAARDGKPSTIPCHLQLAIRIDEELNKLLDGVIISQGGVL